MTLDELIETLVQLRETVAAFDQPVPSSTPTGVDEAEGATRVETGGGGGVEALSPVQPGVEAAPSPKPSPENVTPASPRVVVLTQVPGVNSLVCVSVENIWPVQLLKVLNPIGQYTPGVEELNGAFEPSRFNETLDNIERYQLAIMLC